MSVGFELDSSSIFTDEQLGETRQKLSKAMEQLAHLTYSHILERAITELGPTRSSTYVRSLTGPHKVGPYEYDIYVGPSGQWIEQGIPKGFDMLPGLLKSPKAKTGKNGRYLIIPFDHLAEKQTPQQAHLTNTITRHIKMNGLQGAKRTKNGYTLNLHAPPFKGKLMASTEGRSFLQSTTISKRGGKADIKTFRVASEKHKGVKWIHPGIKPFNGVEEGVKWAESNLEAFLDSMGIEL